MTLRKIQVELSVEDIDRELIARGARIPEQERFNFTDKDGTSGRDTIMRQVKALYDSDKSTSLDPALRDFSTENLIKKLLPKIEKKIKRGIWGKDNRMDFYQLEEIEKSSRQRRISQIEESGDSKIKEIGAIKKNSDCVSSICIRESLIDDQNGFSILKVKNYGETFNLCQYEPFWNQPIAVGRLCTGFLVKEDVIVTAGHCACENNVTDLCFVFGYKMLDSSTSVIEIPQKNIYKGVKIIHRVYDPMGSGADWALIKLDRKVLGQSVVKLSEKAICRNQPLYILGHPCGLPLKYTSGAQVRDITDTCFAADLNVYCGNSGSPVFDSETHEVIGIVVRGDSRDFRWTGNGWISIIYPKSDIHSQEPQCTRVSEFINFCQGTACRQ